MIVRIQQHFESLVSRLEQVASLRHHYGSGLFRCRYAFCWYNRRGFRQAKDRDDHISNHGRPWKCTIPSCDPFATIGFTTKFKREEHWWMCHRPTASQLGAHPDSFESLDVAEAQPILFGFIFDDNIESVRQLLAASVSKKFKVEVLISARVVAAREGS